MDKQFYEYLRDKRKEKLSEKAFYTHITKSVAIIVLCMFLMSFAAYAFFEASVESMGNVIKTGEFKVKIGIENETETVETVKQPEAAEIVIETDSESTEEGAGQISETPEPVVVRTIVRQKLDLAKSSANKYETTLKKGKNVVDIIYNSEDNIKTGFCIFKIYKAGKTEPIFTYFTSQLGRDVMVTDGYVSEISFTLNLPVDAKAEIITHWGTSSNYGYYSNNEETTEPLLLRDGDVVNVNIPVPAAPVVDKPTENKPAEDKPVEDKPVEDEPISVTVEEGDSLYEMAREYNTTVDKLVEYNNIEDRTHIEVGQVIKIPPTDWEIPEDNSKNEPVEDEPVEDEPVEDEPAEDEPVEDEPVEDEPVEDEPVEDEPVEDEPIEDEPVEDEPVEDEPVEDEPVEDEPVEDEPIEDEPVEDEPIEDEPVEDEPVEDEPVEDEPVEDEPVEEPSNDTSVEENSETSSDSTEVI